MNIFASAIARLGLYLLTCCVALAPIPFGSNSDGFAGLLGVALSAALLGTLVVPRPHRRVLRLYGATVALAIVVAVWSVVQVAPLDGTAWSSPIWHKARDLIGAPYEAVAVARYQPLYSLGYVLLPVAAFLSALVYVRDNAGYTVFLNIVVAVGAFVTLVCIAQYRYAPGTLLWAEKRHYLGSFTGSFVNPNTAATYFGVLMTMALSAGLGHLERDGGLRTLLRPGRDFSGREELRWVAATAYLGAALVFFVALMLTRSRAGIMSSLAGSAGLVGAFAYLAVRGRTSRLAALGVGALALGGAALLVHLHGGLLVHRLELEGFVDEARACTYRSTWHAIQDHFWQGTGLGTFQDVFPRYRLPQCGLHGHWNMAHNFFLEGMLSLGVAVFVLCGLVVYAYLIYAYARGVHKRRQMRYVPLSCLAILTIVTLHSLVDFSVQIPGLAVTAGSILGAGAAISLESPNAANVRERRASVAVAARRAARARASARLA